MKRKIITLFLLALFSLFGQRQRIQALYDDGRADFLKGDYVSAREKFRRLLSISRTHHLSDNAQFWIGETYMSEAARYDSLGDSLKAKEYYEKALLAFEAVSLFKDKKTPKYADALYESAIALFKLGKYKEAYAKSVKLIAFYPEYNITKKARELIIKTREKEKEVGKSMEHTGSSHPISTKREPGSPDSNK